MNRLHTVEINWTLFPSILIRCFLPAIAAAILPGRCVFGGEKDVSSVVRFQRVFVPEDRIQDWPLGGEKYLPMDAAELERWTAARSPGPAQPAAPAALVRTSRYEAKLVGERLSGRAIFDVVLVGEPPAAMPFEPCNLAIRGAAWLDDRKSRLPGDAEDTGKEQSPHLQISQLFNPHSPDPPPAIPNPSSSLRSPVDLGLGADGKLALMAPRSGRLFLEWSLVGRREASEALVFAPELPAAASNLMILDLPENVAPTIDRGLIEGSASGDDGMRRWRIQLGGNTCFRLWISATGERKPFRPLALLRESRTYDCSLRGVEMSAQWRIQSHNGPLHEIPILLDSGAQLISARMGEETVAWSVSPTQEGSGTRLLLRLPEPIRGVERMIRLAAIAPPTFERPWRLPIFRAEGLMWQEGRITLLASEPLEIHRVVPQNCAQTEVGRLAAPRSGQSMTFQSFDPLATLDVFFSRRKARLEMLDAVSVELDDRGASAQWAARLRLSDEARTDIVADVSPHWTIDSVDTTPSGGVADWSVEPSDGASRNSDDGRRLAIHLAPPLSPSRSIRLVISARRIEAAPPERIKVGELLPLQFREVDDVRQWLDLRAAEPFRLKVHGFGVRPVHASDLPSDVVQLFANPPGALTIELDSRSVQASVERAASVERPRDAAAEKHRPAATENSTLYAEQNDINVGVQGALEQTLPLGPRRHEIAILGAISAALVAAGALGLARRRIAAILVGAATSVCIADSARSVETHIPAASSFLLPKTDAHFGPKSGSPLELSATERGPADRVYRVFVPIDADQKPVGGKVFVPEALYRELHCCPPGASSGAAVWLLSNAVYRGELVFDARGRLVLGSLRAEYDVQVFEPAARVRVPLKIDGKNIIPGGAAIDGRAIEPEWESGTAALTFAAAAAGRHRLSLALRPTLYDAGIAGGFDLSVPRVPDARLELTLPSDAPSLEIPSALGGFEVEPIFAFDEEAWDASTHSQPLGSYRLTADLGPTERLSVRWQNDAAGNGTGRPAVDAEQLLWLKILPGSILLDVRFHLRVVEGRMQQAQLAVDSKLRLLPLEGDEAPSVFLGNDAGPLRTITLRWPRPIFKQTTFTARFLAAGVSPVGKIRLPNVEMLNVQTTRRWMALSVDDALDARGEPADALESISADEFLEAWQIESPTGVALKDDRKQPPCVPRDVFRLPSGETDWTLSTRPREPRVDVEQNQNLRFHEAGADLRFDARIAISSGYVFQYRLIVPTCVRIDGVSVMEDDADRVLRWSREGEDLTIFLNGPASGTQEMSVFGRLASPPGQKIEVPVVVLLQSQVRAATIRLFRRPGVKVVLDANDAGVLDWDAAFGWEQKFMSPRIESRLGEAGRPYAAWGKEAIDPGNWVRTVVWNGENPPLISLSVEPEESSR